MPVQGTLCNSSCSLSTHFKSNFGRHGQQSLQEVGNRPTPNWTVLIASRTSDAVARRWRFSQGHLRLPRPPQHALCEVLCEILFGISARSCRPRIEQATLKLSQAVETFIERKQATGLHYVGPAKTLRRFYRRIGDLPLKQVELRHVRAFLDESTVSTNTWIGKRNLLLAFFTYWRFRGQANSLPIPAQRRWLRPAFVPYIYSRTELRRLLKATCRKQRGNCYMVSPKALRILLLFLYGTGAPSSMRSWGCFGPMWT